MAKISKIIDVSRRCILHGKLAILLIFIAICVISRPAKADTSIYVFDPNQSTVVRSGGIAGIQKTFAVAGQFRLTVDLEAGTASFDKVDAGLTDETGSVYGQSLDEIFNMTGIAGTIIDGTTIQFEGKTADGTESDVSLKLTLGDDSAQLAGSTTPPPNSADMFFYEIDGVATKKYAGGTGEPNNPYLIYTVEQLNAIGAEPNDWDKHFKLMADIDLSSYLGIEFNIIGIDRNNPFTGIFNGNNHTIYNFTYTTTGTSGYIGLFGCINHTDAIVENLNLIDPNVNATGHSGYVGSLVGYLGTGKISGCSIDGGGVSGYDIVGGLAGLNLYGEISNCSATDSVWGVDDRIGGLVGENSYGKISNCCAAGNVRGVRDRIGGLVGSNSGMISSCYATGNVFGDSFIGGLVGYNLEYITSVISNCYATGSVTGNYNIGGLAGGNYNGIILASFWDIQASGQITSAGGVGKTTAEMQMASTFHDAGWDFIGEADNGTEDIWSICEGTNYPRLVWQIPAGDFVCPDGITLDDFLFFMEHWLDENCDPSNDYCQGTDLDQSGTVDIIDLEIFFENWMDKN